MHPQTGCRRIRLFQRVRRFCLSANSLGRISNGFAIAWLAKTSASSTWRATGALGKHSKASTFLFVWPTANTRFGRRSDTNSISAGDVKAIVKTFREGSWAAKSEKLILAVQASLADTKVQDAIEHEAAALKEIGIAFVPRDGDGLSNLLRAHPEIIDDFFGREWVKAFLGPDAAAKLGARLDGAEFARVREQLRKYYDVHFHLLDVGIALPLSPAVAPEVAPSLLQRFAIPDVLVRDTIFEEQRATKADKATESAVKSDLAIQCGCDLGPRPSPRICPPNAPDVVAIYRASSGDRG